MKGHFTPASGVTEDEPESVEITNMNMIQGYDNPALVIAEDSPGCSTSDSPQGSTCIDVDPPPYREKTRNSSGSSKNGLKPESGNDGDSALDIAIARSASSDSLAPEAPFNRRLRFASLELEDLQENVYDDDGLF